MNVTAHPRRALGGYRDQEGSRGTGEVVRTLPEGLTDWVSFLPTRRVHRHVWPWPGPRHVPHTTPFLTLDSPQLQHHGCAANPTLWPSPSSGEQSPWLHEIEEPPAWEHVNTDTREDSVPPRATTQQGWCPPRGPFCGGTSERVKEWRPPSRWPLLQASPSGVHCDNKGLAS